MSWCGLDCPANPSQENLVKSGWLGPRGQPGFTQEKWHPPLRTPDVAWSHGTNPGCSPHSGSRPQLPYKCWKFGVSLTAPRAAEGCGCQRLAVLSHSAGHWPRGGN